MADQGEANIRRVFRAGSEEDFDVICDPCLNEGQRVQASGHCIDCSENLCESCFKLHKKFSALKTHDLWDKSTLSHLQKSELLDRRSAEMKNPLIDRCPTHPEELIKFYCNIHHQLCCSVCIHLNHGSCNDTSYIRDISDGVADKKELKQVQGELKHFVNKFSSIRSRTKRMKQVVNDSYSKVVGDVSNLKKEAIELLDQLQNEILREVLAKKDGIIEVLDNTLSTCEDMIEKAGEIITDIEKKNKMGHYNRLFISMKTTHGRIRYLAEKAYQVSGNTICERLSFQPDTRLTDLLSNLTSLGAISLVSETPDVKAEYQHDIAVTSGTATDNCLISGIDVLPSGQLALTDYNNLIVKLIDVPQRNVIGQIKLEKNPVDLTLIKGDKLAVILKGKRYLQIISVLPDLRKCHTIAVPGLYNGIGHFSDKFFLVCVEPIRGVHICDMSGGLLQQIETDFDGNKLFTWPSGIALSPHHGVMHITDYTENTVVSLAMDGALISKYKSERLKRPRGIAVDDGGCVYVCSYNNHCVHLLTPKGQHIKTLLEHKGWTNHPYAIAHTDGNLYISSDTNIKVYRLTEIQ